jgi:RNA polymerase sigma-70 factor (ECF subfamily)
MITEQELDWLIVERVHAGDKQAFNLLVIKYQTRIFRPILRIVRNQSEAEEIVQETFIRAYRALRYFRGDAAFYTWLYRIGLNAAKNSVIRQSRRHAECQLDESALGTSESLHSGNETPETIFASRQVAVVINTAIDNLPPMLRMAIVLREIEGLSYEQISAVMECPIGTVRSRIFRAREVISHQLNQILEHPSAFHH